MVYKNNDEHTELLRLLQRGMPGPNRRCWHKADELQAMLKENGLPSLPDKAVVNALRSNRDNMNGIGVRPYNKKTWYCFETDPDRRLYDAPQLQMKAMRTVLGGEADVQREFFVSEEERQQRWMPPIPENHFGDCCELHHLRRYAESELPAETPADDPAREDRDDTTSRRITDAPARDSVRVTPLQTAASAQSAIRDDAAPKAATGGKSHLPCRPADARTVSPLPTGIVLMDLDGLDDFQRNVVEKHARCCPSGSLRVVKQVKEGYDLDRTYYCGFCKKSFAMSTGPSAEKQAEEAPKKRGKDMRPINKMMSTAIFNSGAPAKQVQEIFVDAGAVCPSERGLGNMLDKVKVVAEYVSEATLRQNRKDHVRAARAMAGYVGDHEFTDASGRVHKICVGPVAVDGNGEKRAYNHIITGDQHCTVIVSLITGEPLYVWHDQISCIHCQRKLTEVLNDPSKQKRAQDLDMSDLSHPGKECHRNSPHGPAGAEEHAVEEISKFLLIDPDTNDFRPDDEAILANFIIADGDTKGPNKFINKQAELVPSFQGKAQYLPDIGHFIKCISNAFFALANKNTELRGKSLLEAPRIRCMCANISKCLRDYGREYRELSTKTDAASKEKLGKCRERVLARISSVVHHHCGDHEHCSSDDCLYLQLESHHVAMYRAETDDSTKTREEILALRRDEINEDYAEKSRFRGMTMSMGQKGRAKILNEITKRLDAKNVDRVSLAMTSNGCENFFSRLVKFTCGKRIYFGKTNGWKVRCLYNAASLTDKRITDKVRNGLGVTSTSVVRESRIGEQLHRQEYRAEYRKTEKYTERRRLKKLAKCKEVAANTKNPARHKTGKLSPKEDCKSTEAKPSQPKKRKNPCPNCKGWHPGKCPEPRYRARRKKIKIDEDRINSLF